MYFSVPTGIIGHGRCSGVRSRRAYCSLVQGSDTDRRSGVEHGTSLATWGLLMAFVASHRGVKKRVSKVNNF